MISRILILIVAGMVATNAATYYADYATGNDANNGTSKLTPFKRLPYMGKFTGTYTHSPGDTFVLKGGVTWPNECFTMQVMAGGSSSGTRDTYTVDQTWFAGSSWTRPVFDAGGIELSGGYDVMVLLNLTNAPPWITFDNIEMRNLYWSGSKPYSWVAFFNLSASPNITIQNCYLHNWTHGALSVGTTDALKCIIGSNSSPFNPGCTIVNCTFDGENTQNATNGSSSGEGTYAYSGDIWNSTFKNMTSGCIVTGDPAASSYQLTSGNNIGPCYVSFDPNNHSDGLFMNGGNKFKWWNNYIHDCAVIGLFCGNGSGAETTYVWNNVLWNNNSAPIQVDGINGPTTHVYADNNTLVGGSFPGLRLINRSTGNLNSLSFINNHVITDTGIALSFDTGITVTSLTNQNSVVMGTTAATGAGYTVANLFQPTATNSPTVNAGQDLSAVLNGALTNDIRGVTRPSGWAKSNGGPSTDGGQAIATDGSGNIYALGYFSGTANFNGTNLVSNGGTGMAIAKYNSVGVQQWVVGYSGTSGGLNPTAIALDAGGNIFVGGYFTGVANVGGANLTSAGQQDCFLAKYNSGGGHLWSQRFGGTGADTFNAIALDTSGNVVAAGSFQGNNINFGGTNISSAFGTQQNIVLAKYNSSGTHLWSETFVSSNNNFAYGVAVDPADNSVIITGQFFNNVNFGGGTLSSAAFSTPDLFLAKMAGANGAYVWAKRYGGVNGERASAIALDGSGNPVIGGIFDHATDLGGGPITGTGFSSDMFIAKYAAADGSYLWAVDIQGDNGGAVNSMTVDAAGNVVLAGYYFGTVHFGSLTFTSVSGSNDGYIAKYTGAGSPVTAVSYGGPSADQGNGVAFDASQQIVATGFYGGTVAFGNTVLTSAGGLDFFVVRLSSGWDAGAYEFVPNIAPSPGALQLASSTYATTETSGSVSLTVQRTGGSGGAVTVNYATSNGTATAGHDYTAGSGTLSWTDGDASNKTIVVFILNSGDTGTNSRNFTVTLSAPSGGASLGSPSTATVSIALTPPPLPAGVISWQALGYTTAETNASVTLTAVRQNGTNGVVTANWATVDGSALAGHDYTGNSGTITWAAADSANKTVTVSLINSGDTPCTNRTFTASLSAPTGGASLGSPSTSTVTIQMNCPPIPPPATNFGVIAFSPAPITVSEQAGSVLIPVQRLNGTNGAVSVSYATANGNAAAGTDYTATSGTLSWTDGDNSVKTITVPILNSSTVSTVQRSFTVTLSSPTGGATLGSPSVKTVSITMDANMTVTIQLRGTTFLGGTVTLGK